MRLTLPALLFLAAWLLRPLPASAQLSGTAHDFSSDGWSGGKICVVCHIPHHADASASAGPLWNHEVSTATYTPYSSPTMSSVPGQPRGPSKLCLSCHDGTVAVDSFGGMSGSDFVTGSAAIGADLSDDHPISILWTHQTEVPACSNCHSAWPLPFFAGYVECSTCHDVHNGTGFPYLLNMPKAGSVLCKWCHGK
jgi:predicted CXXCH cytochrome family protein